MDSQQITEEIRSKVDIVELVREYVELKKAGRNWKACCPFHKESTPSFMVSQEKQLAYCFGCQKGGDIFAFVMEVEKVDFPDALRILAEKARVELPTTRISFTKKNEKERYYQILEDATLFFEKSLQKEAKAMSYVKERGLTDETIKKFRVGYAPNSFDDLWKYLREDCNHSTDDILKVGLLANKGEKLYNKFRNRVMFPIHNKAGQIIAFTGRILGEGEPKYLNSPETPVYHKSDTLFGFYFAKPHIREKNEVIIVEGQMDVIAAHQAGIEHTVAVSGTAFTKEQVDFLKRFAPTFYLAFDADSAGWDATKRNAEVCLDRDVLVKVLDVTPHKVKDIDELLTKHGKQALESVLEKAISFHDALFQKLKKHFPPNTLEGKRSIIKRFLPFVKKLHSPMEQEHYLKMLSRTLAVGHDALVMELQKVRMPKVHENVSAQFTIQKTDYSSPESIFLSILLTYPDLYTEFEDKIYFDNLQGEFQNYIYNIFKNEYNFEGKVHDGTQVLKLFDGDARKKLEMMLLYVEDHNIVRDKETARVTFIEKLHTIYVTYKKQLIAELHAHQEQKDFKRWKETYDALLKVQSLT